MKRQVTFTSLFILFPLALSTCSAPTPTIPPTPLSQVGQRGDTPTVTVVPPTATPAPPTATPRPAATATPAPLPPEPRAMKFKTSDGQELNGRYYPSALRPAPLVVLMHWAGGDQYDWAEIAYWVQNRGLGGKTANPGKLPWLDSSWFPKMPAGKSFAVFTFTFRNCEGGCKSMTREGWLLDAQAAMNAATGLEGVNRQQIFSIGASIGADGVADGWMPDYGDAEGILIASLSPGGYLGVPYANAVKALGSKKFAVQVACLYSEQDAESAPACKSGFGARYRAIGYPGNAHGMRLIDPGIKPNVLQMFLEFLTGV